MGHRSGLYDGALATAREGCCQTWPKPCTYHEGYGDGYEQAVQDSAAPDMLAALESITKHQSAMLTLDILALVTTAIAKAKGE